MFASDETSVENTIGDGAHHELTRNTYDLYGQWTTKHASRDEMVNKDPRYLDKLGEIGELFLPGSGMCYLGRRVV